MAPGDVTSPGLCNRGGREILRDFDQGLANEAVSFLSCPEITQQQLIIYSNVCASGKWFFFNGYFRWKKLFFFFILGIILKKPH